ncbi:TPA: hypothetical protein U5E31_003799 [Yersinia enterocolitica]|nr:hypothetical protein [Yersinia enterocolitica]
MNNRKPNPQQNNIWVAVYNSLITIVKMFISILAFVLTAHKGGVARQENSDDGWRDGHSGCGFYVGDIRSDDD